MYNYKDLPNYLCQGDIIKGYENDQIPKFKPEKYFKGLLVLNYTCDLKNNDSNHLNICPIYSIEPYVKKAIDEQTEICMQQGKFKRILPCLNNLEKAVIETIKWFCEYKPKNFFYLPPNTLFNDDPCYADLEQISSIELIVEKEIEEKKVKKYIIDEILPFRKICLESTYREKLGFKLGYRFNRIAIKDFDENYIKCIYTNNYQNRVEKIIDDYKTENESK